MTTETQSTPGTAREKQTATRTWALVGNPNSGKTTIFNALTGLRQKVANYPGVTVERKEGTAFSQHGQPVTIIDLPGAYSLVARSVDEQVMQDVLFNRRADTPHIDGILCVLDASNLERNLFFATQLLELRLPVILVLNMMDVARANGLEINVAGLSEQLGTTVIPTEAARNKGFTELRLAISRNTLPVSEFTTQGAHLFEEAIVSLSESRDLAYAHSPRAEATLRLAAETPEDGLAAQWRDRLDTASPGWLEDLVARRYGRIGEVMRKTVSRHDPTSPSATEQVDKVLLHPVYGSAALIGMLSVLFYSIFKFAEVPMDVIDGLFGALGSWVGGLIPEGPINSLLVDGIIAGVGGVVIFLPQILLLFFFIGLLESTGYMARAAFILDRLMSRVGLNGKSFIPLLSSYACAIPGIMGARTIESPRERLATIFIAPWMSCTARLPVYFVMIAVFAGGNAGALTKTGLMLFVYGLGTAGAFVTAWLFRKTLLKGHTIGQAMELPPYRLPDFRSVVREMADRGLVFLRKAGGIILGLSILIWFSLEYPQPPEDAAMTESEALEQSIAGRLGKAIEPTIAPLGYDWRIGIAVINSFAAREVFVSTLAIIYNLDEDAAMESEGESGTTAIVARMVDQVRADGAPLFTPLVCLSVLVFYVFAMQCAATVAIVRRETNSWRWPLFQLGFMTVFAYLAALLVYQGGLILGFS